MRMLHVAGDKRRVVALQLSGINPVVGERVKQVRAVGTAAAAAVDGEAAAEEVAVVSTVEVFAVVEDNALTLAQS